MGAAAEEAPGGAPAGAADELIQAVRRTEELSLLGSGRGRLLSNYIHRFSAVS